jgi:hypothetical protein
MGAVLDRGWTGKAGCPGERHDFATLPDGDPSASPVAGHSDPSKTASANQRRDNLCAYRARRVYGETLSGMERFTCLFVEIQQRMKY